ncbi:MAG: hypothetical protein UY07_C0027G0004 [Parcubacteria group bacterium GW2011_GWA1_47_8]|nr:MAG: hypothetical protein UY07_C0027G0004 [Parcubacteria group bacterium GW2011_GWA1_47_8]KKW07043.1 MAG: hypothetical protein UY42_C0019G0009 [Parcubacteria group bacterium GW2011_GWA2_49_16]
MFWEGCAMKVDSVLSGISPKGTVGVGIDVVLAPGARKEITKLGKIRDIVIVVPFAVRSPVEARCKHRLPQIPYRIYYENEEEVSLMEVCIREKISISVACWLHEAISLSRVGVTVLLFNTAYNQSELSLPWNVTRMHGWDKILENILLEKY